MSMPLQPIVESYVEPRYPSYMPPIDDTMHLPGQARILGMPERPIWPEISPLGQQVRLAGMYPLPRMQDQRFPIYNW